jgi:hypothetical protein
MLKASPDEEIVLVFDTKLKRPGCVLLQAIGGCGHNNHFMEMLFDNWLTAPTPDMRRIRGTRAQWEKLAAQLNPSRKQTNEKISTHASQQRERNRPRSQSAPQRRQAVNCDQR